MRSIIEVARLSSKAFLTLLFILGAISLSPAQSEEPKTDSPDIQQLKERIKLLEETVQELKRQVATVEQSQKPVATTEPRIIQAVAQSEPAAQPAPPVVPDPLPPSVGPVAKSKSKSGQSTGESTFEVYGFAMLDAGYQFGQNDPDWFDVIRPTKLPSFEDEFAPSGKVYYGVRQTRFGVKSSTPTSLGELKTQFEFELFGTGADAGQTTFRLRHAYGELGQFGAGQYWSPFMDIDVFPNSIEYWGPVGMVFFRNVQFRWMPLKGKNAITIALERPGASGDQGRFEDRNELQGVRPKFDLPDLSGHVRFNRKWGHVQIAGLLRRIKWTDETDDNIDLDGDTVAGGVNVTSNLKFTPKDTGRFSITYGTGIQNYMNDATVDIGIAAGNTNDPRRPIRGVALPLFAMVAFLDHSWNKKFSTSVGYSMQNMNNSDGQSPSAFKRGHYALGNLLYYPVENVMIGGELQWGKRENFLDGFSSDDVRIQFSFRYNFSKLFKF